MDALEIINIRIQAQKTWQCNTSENDLFYFLAQPFFNPDNQVLKVDESYLINSDGMYFFIGQREKIVVADLNTNHCNVSLHASPTETYITPQLRTSPPTFLTSLFINNNVLTERW